MNNPEFEIVSDVIDCFPDIFFNIKSLYLLNIVEGKFTANSRLWLQAFSTNNKDVLLIELAYTECLSRLLKTWKEDPFLARNRKELTSIKTLNIWFASIFLISICHTSKDVQVVLILMDYMICSWVEHVIEWLQQRSVLIKIERLLEELSCLWVESTEHKQISLGSDHIPSIVRNIELVLNHNCLSHVVHDLVRVDELSSLLKIENTREN